MSDRDRSAGEIRAGQSSALAAKKPAVTRPAKELPLAGLQVIDLSSGPAGGLASMELADFGARVVRYPDPNYEYLNHMPSARMWLRGKARGHDLEADLAVADVLIITYPNGFAELDYVAVQQLNPDIIYCEIHAAGESSTLPPYEAVIAAKTGRMQNMAGIIQDAGPHFAAVPVASHATAQNVVAGVLAAVYQRRYGGGGQRVRTSLLQGFMPYDMGQSLFLQVKPDREAPDMSRILPSLNYHPVQCADGRWLQLGNLLPHLFESFMRVVGLESLITELPDNLESVREQILSTMQTRPCAEWMELFVADGGVAAHPYLNAAETLDDSDMTANGHVVTLDGVKQLGPVATLTDTPAAVTGEAKPATGFDWKAVVEDEAVVEDDSGAPMRCREQLPLSGVTVLELATIIASPLGASFLADMGARVIKVEALGGDPFRHMGGGIGATRCNQGKESISVDLKSAAGQKIVQALARDADILIHNFRPGVPERLGIDFELLSRDNPGLIYISANGYGPSGPGAMRPSTHPIPGAAMGGAGYQAGGTPSELLSGEALVEAARRIMRANEVNPDPNTAVVVCAASLLGLLARETTGRGQQIFVDMFAANAYANFDDLVDFADKPSRPSLGVMLRGPETLYRLYEAADGWVFLGIKTAAEWQRFREVTGFECELNLAADPIALQRLSEVDSVALSEALSHHFRSRDAADWETLLLPEGIGCVQADAMNTGQYFASEAREGSEWMALVDHAELGSCYRHKPMVNFRTTNDSLQAGVRAGVDGPALLEALGYSAVEVEALFDQGVLFSVDHMEAS